MYFSRTLFFETSLNFAKIILLRHIKLLLLVEFFRKFYIIVSRCSHSTLLCNVKGAKERRWSNLHKSRCVLALLFLALRRAKDFNDVRVETDQRC